MWQTSRGCGKSATAGGAEGLVCVTTTSCVTFIVFGINSNGQDWHRYQFIWEPFCCTAPAKQQPQSTRARRRRGRELRQTLLENRKIVCVTLSTTNSLSLGPSCKFGIRHTLSSFRLCVRSQTWSQADARCDLSSRPVIIRSPKITHVNSLDQQRHSS